MNKTKLFLALSTALTITACGGGSGGGGGTSGGGSVTETTDIKAIDGYLGSAYVYADKDKDGVADDNEFQGKTDENGVFPLDNNMLEYPLIVKAVAGETTDSDKITPITKSFELTAPAGSQFVTPFTTLAHQEDKTSDEMDSFVAELNLDSSAAGDYIAAKETNDDAKKVHAIARSLTYQIAENTLSREDIGIINDKLEDLINNGEDIDKVILNGADYADTSYIDTNLSDYVAGHSYYINVLEEGYYRCNYRDGSVTFSNDGLLWQKLDVGSDSCPFPGDDIPELPIENVSYTSDQKGWQTDQGIEKVIYMQEGTTEYDFSFSYTLQHSYNFLVTFNLMTNKIYTYSLNNNRVGVMNGINDMTRFREFYLLTDAGTDTTSIPTLSRFEINEDNTLKVFVQKGNDEQEVYEGTWEDGVYTGSFQNSVLTYNNERRYINLSHYSKDSDLLSAQIGSSGQTSNAMGIFSENKDLITSIYNQWVANMK